MLCVVSNSIHPLLYLVGCRIDEGAGVAVRVVGHHVVDGGAGVVLVDAHQLWVVSGPGGLLVVDRV